jgi:hypothetical protein
LPLIKDLNDKGFESGIFIIRKNFIGDWFMGELTLNY